MGYGQYSYEAHQALTQNRAGQSTQQVFSQSSLHPSMNPYGVKVRESRDSDEHPQSLAIIFALDVSGSMGVIPTQLATKELPGFMKMLGECRVASPQVLFMAFTDHESDGRPLQVGQFETTAELMDQWLTRCSLSGGGEQRPAHLPVTGGYRESYDLALHFAARHTAIDCFEKRGKKGYLFITGDEPPYEQLRSDVVEHVIGTKVKDMPLSAMIDEVKKTYEPFFLVPDSNRFKSIAGAWQPVLGERVIEMRDPADTCAVAAGLVGLGEGNLSGIDELRDVLKKADYARTEHVLAAIEPCAASMR